MCSNLHPATHINPPAFGLTPYFSIAWNIGNHWRCSCICHCVTQFLRVVAGGSLVSLAIEREIVIPKKRNVMLPILVVLFLISYGLLSMLVVEQGRTIESQRSLIRDLSGDSSQLSSMKIQEIIRNRAAGQAHVPALQTPRHNAAHGSRKRQQPSLQKPPQLTADTPDSRRMPFTI